MTAQEFVDKFFSLTSAEQKPRVVPYGTKVSDHLTVGIDLLESPDTEQFTLLPQTVALFEKAREIVNSPIQVDAGFRTVAHELALQGAGYRTAKFISPHCLGAALDLRIPGPGVDGPTRNATLQSALLAAAKDLGYPQPRLGHWIYAERFTHVDLVFLCFQPYTDVPHPKDWSELDAAICRELGASWVPGLSW
jgi:hypothetical protein